MPSYYKHFTIAKLVDGKYETLDYGWGNKLSDLPSKLELQPGQYRLLTGMRNSDGIVFSRIKYVQLERGKDLKQTLEFRDPAKEMQSLGKTKLSSTLLRKEGKATSLKSLFNRKHTLLIWVEPGKEPTRHLMEEFLSSQKQYEDWGGNIAIIKAQHIEESGINKDFLKNMPSNYKIYHDNDNKLLKHIKSSVGIKGKVILPLVVVLDKDGNIFMASRGYKIGLHEQILSIIR